MIESPRRSVGSSTRFTRLGAVPLALLFVLLTPSIRADTITLHPSKDNTLFDPLTGAETSAGAGVWLFTGRTGFSGGNRLRRSLFAFDVAAEIPAGSTIDSVELRLLQLDAAPGLVPTTVQIHRVLADWGEGTSSAGGGSGAPATPGDATWTLGFYPDSATAWTNPGGDFDPAVLSSTTVTGVVFVTRTWGATASFIALTQQWLDDPSSNFGLMVRHQNESSSQTSVKWASREDSFSPPELVIEFTPSTPIGPDFQRLDCNADGDVQVSDPVFAVSSLFVTGDPLPCADACDANDDGVVDIADVITALSFLFTAGGTTPPPPFPGCGPDPTPDATTCDDPGICP
ncbi:MAG: DNRLRE domain-containing protein [Planctomycetes bacterium]|nr:DNRLRE domain-containing protein [Planctomycetota bacterium]